MSIISDGEALAVYPDDETTRIWNDERWDVVTAGFTKDRSELALTKAIDDRGVGIRRYPKQRVSVHINVKGFGKAQASPPAPSGAWATPSSFASPSKSPSNPDVRETRPSVARSLDRQGRLVPSSA